MRYGFVAGLVSMRNVHGLLIKRKRSKFVDDVV